MEVRIEGKKLIIEIETQTPAPSKTTGKTMIVATTGGNKQTEVKVNGKPLVIGLTAYYKP